MAPPMTSGSRGFTYLGLMLFMVIAGIGLAVAGKVWQTEVQREKEKELLFVGEQFRQAIGSYYESTPTGVKQYPPALEDLLQDPRFPEMRRHLRRIYPDPMTGSTEWGLVKDQERIVGVYSKSDTPPLMKTLIRAETYADWTFVYKSKDVVATPGVQPSVAGISASLSVIPPSGNISQPVNMSKPEPSPTNNPGDSCASQSISDYATCSEVCIEASSDIDICTACYNSLKERELACKQKRTLPPVVTK